MSKIKYQFLLTCRRSIILAHINCQPFYYQFSTLLLVIFLFCFLFNHVVSLLLITLDNKLYTSFQAIGKMSIEPQFNVHSDHLHFSQDSKDSICGDSTTHSIFQKYKLDTACNHFPFKLFEFDESQDHLSHSEKSKKARGCYRKYTLEQKLEAVEKINNGFDLRKISQQYGIPRRNLLRWRRNGCERKQGGGRPTDIQMETILFEKIKQNILSGQKNIRKEAMTLSNSKGFKASKGWYTKFCRRHHIKFSTNSKYYSGENQQNSSQ